MVPLQPCVMLAWPASKVLRSSSVGLCGAQRTVNLVLPPTSSNVKVDSICSGQLGAIGHQPASPARQLGADDHQVGLREQFGGTDGKQAVVARPRADERHQARPVVAGRPRSPGLLRPWPFLDGLGSGRGQLLGGVALARFYRRGQATAPPPLSAAERRRLAAVLGEGTER